MLPFPKYHDLMRPMLEAWGSTAREEDPTPGASDPPQETETTPEEQIASGIEQLEANVRGELLQREIGRAHV